MAIAGDSNISEEFFHSVVKSGQVDAAVAVFESTGGIHRWRPLYEALRAVQAGSPDYLRNIAPEVRVPAGEIFVELMSH